MKRRDTKTAILDCAQDFIQRRGANATSFADISKKVGIRSASIHYHFPTKEQLLHALITRYSRNFLALVDSILHSDAGPEMKLRRYALLFETTLSEGGQEKACLCGVLAAEMGTLGSAAAEEVRKFFRENESRLVKILHEGKRADVFKFAGDLTSTASVVFSLMQGSLLLSRAEGNTKRISSVIRQMMKLLNP